VLVITAEAKLEGNDVLYAKSVLFCTMLAGWTRIRILVFTR
jgi:hypothetical protein